MKALKLLIVLALSFPIFSSAQENRLLSPSKTGFNPSLKNRYSLMAGVNSSLTKASELKNFSFAYSRQIENFWIDGNIMMTQGLFKNFSENNPAATQSVDPEMLDQENTMITIGIGVAKETTYSQNLFSLPDLYEFMSANLTYNTYKEDYSGKSFSGPGLLAKFQAYKRFNDFFSAGINMHYTLALLKRSQDSETESSSSRTLSISTLTFGLGLNFYL